MLLTTIKRKATIFNKLLFMIWGALSILAAQQLWPNHSPVTTPTAANGTSRPAEAEDVVLPQTLGIAADPNSQSQAENNSSSTESTTITQSPTPVTISTGNTSTNLAPPPSSGSITQQEPARYNSKKARATSVSSVPKANSSKSESSARSRASIACVQTVFCL